MYPVLLPVEQHTVLIFAEPDSVNLGLVLLTHQPVIAGRCQRKSDCAVIKYARPLRQILWVILHAEPSELYFHIVIRLQEIQHKIVIACRIYTVTCHGAEILIRVVLNPDERCFQVTAVIVLQHLG